jgi:hypothetical protein
MITAWYQGRHKGDLLGSIGYWLIRLGQWRQKFGRTTHCEAILAGYWYSAVIAGASRRDGKRVRAKVTDLEPGNWRIYDVPLWDQLLWEAKAVNMIGMPYSDAGAVSSASPFWSLLLGPFVGPIVLLNQWCSRFLLQAAGVIGSEDLSTSEAEALVVNLPGTRDITDEFFGVKPPSVIIPTDHPFLHLPANQLKEATQ